MEVREEQPLKQEPGKEVTEDGIMMEIISDDLADDLTSASGMFP